MKSYIQLFLTSIKTKNVFADKSIAVAFTSTQSEEGVSYVVNSFASELAIRTRQRVLVADAEKLLKARIFHKEQIAPHCERVGLGSLYLLRSPEDVPRDDQNTQQIQIRNASPKLEQGLNNLQMLRKAFDFILIDCQSLNDSGEVAFIAPATEGVVLVVEANQTRREQVHHSIKEIKMANGNLIGCVMNKRRYSIPNWLYRRI
jgi:hypothetical protein